MDLDALEWFLKGGGIGTVVMTAGTTGLGAVDPIDKAIPLCRKYGVRVHVDAAYGGFFRLLAEEGDDLLAPDVAAAFRAIDEADSVVIDPHKHGLQPYGCGAVIFRDPNVANFYDHTSPYTYFTSGDDLHMGEISLECSRSGASAAALWMTLQLLPLTREGMGEVVAPGRRAALAWAEKLRASDVFELYQEPDLDIVSYFPIGDSLTDLALMVVYGRLAKISAGTVSDVSEAPGFLDELFSTAWGLDRVDAAGQQIPVGIGVGRPRESAGHRDPRGPGRTRRPGRAARHRRPRAGCRTRPARWRARRRSRSRSRTS